MEHAIYLKCRNPVMTYVDPQTKFKIPRGRIVKYKGSLTKTMQRWIRRGGLKRVEEALYLKQQEAEPKQPSPKLQNTEATPQETAKTEAAKEPAVTQPEVQEPAPPKEAKKPGRKPRKAGKK
nr:hypothetical protein 4 [bacterium]